MTKIILVRHGETTWNKELKYQGQTDIALSEEGVKQAKLVAGRLAKEKINAVYASDLARAFHTAAHIAQKHNLQVVAMPEFREISFGEWEGQTYDTIGSKGAEAVQKFYTCPDEVVIPGGETFAAVKERAMAALMKLVKAHENQTVVVVAHGGTIRTILCSVLNIHLKYLWSIKQDNTAVNIVEFYGDKVLLSLLNDVHHLKG